MRQRAFATPKLTLNRQLVLNILLGMTSHPAVQDLFVEVKKVQPRIGYATVYRCVAWLVEQGLIREVYCDKNGAIHYDADMSRHDHVICVGCNAIVNATPPTISEMFTQLEQSTGFRATQYTTLFLGLCAGCLAQADRRPGAAQRL